MPKFAIELASKQEEQMLRDVAITVDQNSWPSVLVPSMPLQNPASRTQINVLYALIHTALWTRPPMTQGFHLSDYWASLRYRPAAYCQPVSLI
jgi:hypothetical protein